MGLAQELGGRIRQLRVDRGWTQGQLADRADLDPKYVGAIERAEKNTTIAIIERLIAAFGVTARDFFDFKVRRVPARADADEAAIHQLLKGTDKQSRQAAIKIVRTVLSVVRVKRT